MPGRHSSWLLSVAGLFVPSMYVWYCEAVYADSSSPEIVGNHLRAIQEGWPIDRIAWFPTAGVLLAVVLIDFILLRVGKRNNLIFLALIQIVLISYGVFTMFVLAFD